MLNSILPLDPQKKVIIDYINHFANASMIRYGLIDFSNLYSFNAPTYLKNVLDFNFSNTATQLKFESLFNNLHGVNSLNYLLDNKQADLRLCSQNTTSLYYIFCCEKTYFIISHDIDNFMNKNLFIVLPYYCDEDFLFNVEKDLQKFLEIVSFIIR